MEKIKEEILRITKDSKSITNSELCQLLRTYKVKLNPINYDIIYKFLEENEISLIVREDNKKYVLAK